MQLCLQSLQLLSLLVDLIHQGVLLPELLLFGCQGVLEQLRLQGFSTVLVSVQQAGLVHINLLCSQDRKAGAAQVMQTMLCER